MTINHKTMQSDKSNIGGGAVFNQYNLAPSKEMRIQTKRNAFNRTMFA